MTTSILDMLRTANAGLAIPAAEPISAIASSPTAAAPPLAPPATAPDSPNTPQAAARPCSCGFRTFWLDPYNTLRCQACHPPRFAYQVKHTYSVDGEENNYSWSQFSEAQEKIISELVELRTACGRNVVARQGWDDPRSDNFSDRLCLAVAVGLDEADRILTANSDYLLKILRRDGTIDPLPGPWPNNKAEYDLAAPAPVADAAKKPATRKPSTRSKKK